ncbi:BfmA/BtgA family mobilization protein [Mucilaginibacter gracilis]|uniref:BfmA/BtgA family mobilization protein n=1 Tax=Mucilaginibacter gracilis TaxID=423350 RepID=UPI0011C4639B|nr:BfmA/BtgA family mobilization protein [Mucilaginibacter gracilis]
MPCSPGEQGLQYTPGVLFSCGITKNDTKSTRYGTPSLMEDQNIKNIRFPVETDKHLIRLAEKLGRTKLTVFKQMVEYFYRTKKDPLDINDELLKNTIVKGHQNLTGFIRVQEQTLLMPMKQDMDRMIGSQKKILECFNKQILEHNRQSEQQLTAMQNQLVQGQQNKEQLKARFLYLLDSYAKTSSQGGGINKDDLLIRIKEQVKNL